MSHIVGVVDANIVERSAVGPRSDLVLEMDELCGDG